MNIFKSSVLWAGVFALAALSGCASAPQERQEMHTKTMQQTIEANNVELSRACRQERDSAIASAKYEAVSQGESAGTWQEYYRAPVCIMKEQQKKEASRREIPEEFGFTIEDLAKQDYDKLCKSGPLQRMGAGRGMVWLAEQGYPSEFYNVITEECRYRDQKSFRHKMFVRSFFPTINVGVGAGYVPVYGYRSHGYRGRRGGYYGDSRCTTITPGGHVADPGLPLCR